MSKPLEEEIGDILSAYVEFLTQGECIDGLVKLFREKETTREEHLRHIEIERDEARKEIDRLRECARTAQEKVCRMEFDGDTLVVTMPHKDEASERELGQAFLDMYDGLQKFAEGLEED